MTDSFKSSANDSLSSIDTTISCSSNILVTLRRMKIEENCLTKNINKITYHHEDEDYQSNDNNYFEFKKYSNDLKSSLIVIRDLYEEVKANTTSEDNLQVLDIEDVKKDVLVLENKIKTMKAYLQSEISSLKNKERDLVHDDAHEKLSGCNKMHRKILSHKPKFSEMVPSPVKVLISSPFKSPEVQQFQDFMKTSRNRYGGWNAYHHNIFEQAWRKYFGTDVAADDDCDLESWGDQEKQNDGYNLFFEELLRKIPGMPMKDIIEHHKWYTKYIHLKNRQKKALDRWRENKKLIKKHRSNLPTPLTGHVSKLSIDKMDQGVINSVVSDELKGIEKTFFLYDTENSESLSLASHIDESKEKTSGILETTQGTQGHRWRYLQHTSQWRSRCNDPSITSESNFNIEEVQQLGVPVWRLHLQENLL